MNAEASDMSGRLLMGPPGLAVGTYINRLIVSRRLRNYSRVSGDAITVPDFLSNRFHKKKK